ncbi:hypothetical protein Tsubulata_046172, partial [Turnera subulata]
METPVGRQTAQEPSLSTSSSSSSSSSVGVRVFPLSFSPETRAMQVTNRLDHGPEKGEEPAAGLVIERLRFIDIDWQEVETRFDRLASTRKGPEPAVKWSDFGFCVGLQQSTEFANVLLRALRRRTRRNYKTDITKRELYSLWHCLVDPCFDSRVKIFFDMCDRNMDGRITESDIKQAILLCATTNKLSVTHEQAQEHAAPIMEVLDPEGRGYLEQHQVATLLNVSLPKGTVAPASHSKATVYQEPNMSRAEILFRTYW